MTRLLPWFCLFTITLTTLIPEHPTCSDEVFEYTLESSDVNELYLTTSENTYHPGIVLTKHEQNAFADLTQRLIGRRLRVVFEGEVLAEAMVLDRIESGRIGLGQFADYDAAVALLRRVAPRVREIRMIPAGPGPWRERYGLPAETP